MPIIILLLILLILYHILPIIFFIISSLIIGIPVLILLSYVRYNYKINKKDKPIAGEESSYKGRNPFSASEEEYEEFIKNLRG